MANTDPEPWAPDPTIAPGTPPVGGTGGEHGTSSFAGNSNFNADTTRKAGFMGPRGGVTYHDGSVMTSGISTSVLSEATLQARTLTVALAASNLAPVHGTPVTLTATLTPGAAEEPRGTVTFLAGATVLGTADVTAPGDTAVLTLPAGFTAGAHVLHARFDGDANYPVTSSSNVTVTAS